MEWILALLLLLLNVCACSRCPKSDYLLKVHRQLSLLTPLLFSSPEIRESTIASIENTFGVRIRLQPAFAPFPAESLICQSFTQIGDVMSAGKAIEFPLELRGRFVSANVSALQVDSASTTLNVKLSLTSPSGVKQRIYENGCGPLFEFMNAGFDDAGVPVDFTSCADIVNGAIYRPVDPFALFSGSQVKGTWSFDLETGFGANYQLSWTLCYTELLAEYTRDMSRSSLMNSPSISCATGRTQLTNLLFDSYAQATFVTIEIHE